MVAHGVSIEEQTAARGEGIGIAEQVKPMSWSELMQTIHHVIVTEFVPRYQSHADAAKARGRSDEEVVCLYMVEHEKAQVEFARRELAGARRRPGIRCRATNGSGELQTRQFGGSRAKYSKIADSLAERSHFELASDFDAPEPALRLRRGTEKGPSLFEPDP
jgi:hypothetical protein